MLKIVTDSGTKGPFETAVKDGDNFIADGTIYPISIIGDGTVEEWTDPLPVGEPEGLADLKRQQRNQLLAKTDWRAGSDLTMSQEWIDYRQALRDVPEQDGFPRNITWPTEP